MWKLKLTTETRQLTRQHVVINNLEKLMSFINKIYSVYIVLQDSKLFSLTYKNELNLDLNSLHVIIQFNGNTYLDGVTKSPPLMFKEFFCVYKYMRNC